MNINKSEEIKDLITALAKAQGMMKPAVFNKGNPHFKSRYADFNSCMDACRIPLSENGLAVIQYCDTIEGKMSLVTMLAHTSGQWMRSEFPLYPSKLDSQGIGSAMTYAKRYSLCGMVGIVADEDLNDDDAETSVGRGKNITQKQPNVQSHDCYLPPKTRISEDQIKELNSLKSQLGPKNLEKLMSYLKNIKHGDFNNINIDQYKILQHGLTCDINSQKESNAQIIP